MYVRTNNRLGQVSPSKTELPLPAPRVLTYTTKDVIDQRISVPAQHALVRLSKNQATSADAVGMLEAIKTGRLGGIYCVNWKKPYQRAKRMGKSWGEAIPKGEDAVLMLDPDNPINGVPLIAFRRELDPRPKQGCGLLPNEKPFPPSPERLDSALLKAWSGYRLWQVGLPPESACNGYIVGPNSLRRNQYHSGQISSRDIGLGNAPSCTAHTTSLDKAVNTVLSVVDDEAFIRQGMYTGLNCFDAVGKMVTYLHRSKKYKPCINKNIFINLDAKSLCTGVSNQRDENRFCVVKYTKGLNKIVLKMKKALDHCCLIKAGAISGLGPYYDSDQCDNNFIKKPKPEHYILIIGYEGDKFVFWDSNGRASKSHPKWGQGFGVLYFDHTANRLSTARDDSAMTVLQSGNHDTFECRSFLGQCQKRFQISSLKTV